jgi:hypothetical protein
MELSYLLCADIYKRNALACQLQYNMPYTYQSSDALTISVCTYLSLSYTESI